METMDPTSVHMAVAACKMLHGSISSNDAAESAEAVEILRQHQVEFDYIDVLEHPSLRLGKKIHLAMVCHWYWWRPLRMPDPQRSTDCRSGD
jgi:glutaredoxin-related protein